MRYKGVLMGSNNFLNIIENIEPGIVILNKDLSISHINRILMLMFSDFPRERLFQGSVLDLHSDKIRRKMIKLFRLTEEAKRQIPLSLKIIRHDGLDSYFLIKLIPLIGRDVTDEKLSALFYDITPFVSSERKLTRVPVTSGGEIQLLKPEEIVYLKADNIYCRVFTEVDEFHCDLSIGALEKRLSRDMFFRIHRSYLVNTAKVRKVQKDRSECSAQLREGEVRLPISRDKLQEFLVEIGLK
jgi:DNA-binding LytR/AlgR family response regulator